MTKERQYKTIGVGSIRWFQGVRREAKRARDNRCNSISSVEYLDKARTEEFGRHDGRSDQQVLAFFSSHKEMIMMSGNSCNTYFFTKIEYTAKTRRVNRVEIRRKTGRTNGLTVSNHVVG